MRQQILIATFALLLVAAFLAVWASALPGAPAVPFAAPLGPTAAPTPTPRPTQPQAETPPTPTARPLPTPTATTMPPTPTPLPPTPPAPPPPTATPPPPTPTPLPPTPTPEPLFIAVTEPADTYTEVHTDNIAIAGNTLPWSTVLVRVDSSAQDPQEIFARANGDGVFDVTVPQLTTGSNAITIIAYHTISDEEKREHRVVDYNPNPRRLYITVIDPDDGAVVTERLLTITGRTLPDARVTVNDIIPVPVAEDGEWQTVIVLQPGPNGITAEASRNGQRRAAAITVTYNAS